jgi:hypothetical protein
MTLGHIAGLPVEEGVRALAPAGAAFAYVVLTWLRRR